VQRSGSGDMEILGHEGLKQGAAGDSDSRPPPDGSVLLGPSCLTGTRSGCYGARGGRHGEEHLPSRRVTTQAK
jgi:hypothetical protein